MQDFFYTRPCIVRNCPFYAPDNIKTCSAHYGLNAYVFYNTIPDEIIRRIIVFTQGCKTDKEIMTDLEIIEKLGLDVRHEIYDDKVIDERAFWLGHTNIQAIHCDRIDQANSYLNLSGTHRLSKCQAEKLISVIESKFDRHTRIAFEKAIFMQTFAPTNLDRDMFAIAYCYIANNKPPIVRGMNKQTILSIFQTLRVH